MPAVPPVEVAPAPASSSAPVLRPDFALSPQADPKKAEPTTHQTTQPDLIEREHTTARRRTFPRLWSQSTPDRGARDRGTAKYGAVEIREPAVARKSKSETSGGACCANGRRMLRQWPRTSRRAKRPWTVSIRGWFALCSAG